MEFLAQRNEYCERIDTALEAYIRNSLIPKSLSDAMAYSLLNGGKRLRPCMVLAACDMVGGDTNAALPVACGLEMIHTYSLIHDDLPCMDNDDYRRGKPSNHIAFKESTALLAGDALLSYAFQIMLQAQKEFGEHVPSYTDAIRAVAEGAGVWGMVAGQIRDLECESQPDAGEKELLYIHSHKTGAMLRASILAGAFMKPLNTQVFDSLSRFGDWYGLLFQITDDILDETGNREKLGKTAGKDLTSGKLTYVKLYGMEESLRKAAKAARRAKESITSFGDKAEFFNKLVDYTLSREG